MRRFALAISGLGLASLVAVWSALLLLARVTPALFPGQELSLSFAAPQTIRDVVSSVPDQLQLQSPGPDSVFNRPVVILAVGTDTSPDLGSTNTDSIMLANIDPVSRDLRILSIPRDLLIEIDPPSGRPYYDRVNTSFAVGARNGEGIAGGMEQLAGDIERNFDVEIDYWVQVDFRGAERLFDAIGGVTVRIPEDLAIEQWWYSDNDRPARWLSFPPGLQHLDGYEAVAFSRLREFDDDFHRIRRQQIVMEAALAQAFTTGKLDNIPAMWSAYHDAVHTNVPTVKAIGLGVVVRKGQGDMMTMSLADPVDETPSVISVRTGQGADVLEGVPENIEYWFDVLMRRKDLESTNNFDEFGGETGMGAPPARTGP